MAFHASHQWTIMDQPLYQYVGDTFSPGTYELFRDASKSLSHSNMPGNGHLPEGVEFVLSSVGVEIQRRLTPGGFLELWIGSSNYLNMPLSRMLIDRPEDRGYVLGPRQAIYIQSHLNFRVKVQITQAASPLHFGVFLFGTMYKRSM